MGGSDTGKNPTDRAKLGSKIHILVDQRGAPLALQISGANQHDKWSAAHLVFHIAVKRPTSEQHFCADKAYDYADVFDVVLDQGYVPHIKHRRLKNEPPDPYPVPGELRFTLDIRGTDLDAITALRRRLSDLAEEAEARWGVKVELGEDTGPQPGFLDKAIHARLRAAAAAAGVEAHTMPSGSGHDALAFHHAGIPTGFIFIRSEGAGHTPQEAIAIADLDAAARVLAHAAAAL